MWMLARYEGCSVEGIGNLGLGNKKNEHQDGRDRSHCLVGRFLFGVMIAFMGYNSLGVFQEVSSFI